MPSDGVGHSLHRLRYLSLFSGVGGLDLGFGAAGWDCDGMVEIDWWCQGVLRRAWPSVHVHDDVSSFDAGLVGRVDAIVGGFPCQDVSIAGKRKGVVDGSRSGLWWEFFRIIEVVRPRAVLVENVEGLLSSNSGRDMGLIIDSLVEVGYGLAWRVLDAQHFGLPQRRRRVFLCAFDRGHSGARRASEVLGITQHGGFGIGQDHAQEQVGELAGMGRPRRTGRSSCGSGIKEVVGALTKCMVGAGGGPDDNAAQAGHLVVVDGVLRRITPVECERLMGWPDGHTSMTDDFRVVPDSRRYAMCGNGVAAPVAEWVANRMAVVLEAMDADIRLSRSLLAP